MFFRCFQHGGQWLLDAQVHHVVTVVGQNDVHQVLADIVHVTLDGGHDDFALALCLRRSGSFCFLFHERFQIGHRSFHGFCRLQHEWQLHLSGTKQLTHGLHAVEKVLVDDRNRRLLLHACFQIILKAILIAVDDALCQTLKQRHGSQLFSASILGIGSRNALKQLHEFLQRIVILGAAIIDHIQRHFALAIINAVHRQNLGTVRNRRVQTSFNALIEEHRVEHLACSRVQAEGNIGQTQGGVDFWVELLQLADGFDGFNAISPGFFLASRDREGQAVHNDVFDVQAVAAGDIVNQSFSNAHLVLSGTCLAFLINGQRNHCGTVLLHQFHDALVAGIRAIAVFKVDRVNDASSTQVLKACANNLRLGGVNHDWQGGAGSKKRCEGRHIGGAISSHVIHTKIQHVCTIAGLLLGNIHTLFPIARQHCLTECLGTVGVGALTDHGNAGFLGQWHRGVQRRDGVLFLHLAGGLLNRACRDLGQCGGFLLWNTNHRIADRTDVLRCGATTTTHHGQAIFGDESSQRLRQILSLKWVFCTVFTQDRKTCVRHHRHRNIGMLGQVTQVLAHLIWAGGAVQTNHVDTQWLQRCQRGTDL